MDSIASPLQLRAITGVCALTAVTNQKHLKQIGRGLLRVSAVTRAGVEHIAKQESAQRANYTREENSPAYPAGIRTQDLPITS